MYKRILIPVDGSAASEAAVEQALPFMREQQAKARFVYICEPFQYVLAEGPVDLSAEFRRQGEAVLAEGVLRRATVPVLSLRIR